MKSDLFWELLQSLQDQMEKGIISKERYEEMVKRIKR